MKKLAAMLLIATMATGLLAGCGSSSADKGGSSSSDAATGEDSAVTDGTETAATGSSAPEWAEYDSLIAQIKSSTDMKEREKLMHQAEDMVMDTGAIIPLYYYNDAYMLKTGLDGLRVNNFGMKYFMYMTGKDGALGIQLASEPDKLDPALNSSVDGGCLAVNSFEGLFSYDAEGKVTPTLSESYEVSEDGLTYTFKLKSDLKWSDGSALTAKDFEYSWKRVADPATAADYSYLFDVFAKGDDGSIVVTATDDTTLTCTLAAPCAYFLELLAFPTFMPVPQASVEAANPDGTTPGAWCQEAGFVSNGAYTLQTWNHNESMVYVKNPNYYDAANVTVEQLDVMLSADDTAIYAAYQSDNLDFIDTVANDEIANLIDKDPEFHIVPQLGNYYACFNVNSSLFDGLTVEQAANMRKAINLLIDRDYIATNIGQCGQELANTFIPPAMGDGNGGEFRTNDDDYTFPDEKNVGYFDPTIVDTEQAIELLKTCGYEFDDAGMLSAETPLSMTYLTNNAEGNVKIAEAIQQDLAAVGIELKVQQEEWNVFLESRKAGNFDFAREGWIADYSDPINMLEMWQTDSGNNDCQFGR